jgi:O-glycosyl hydrolase
MKLTLRKPRSLLRASMLLGLCCVVSAAHAAPDAVATPVQAWVTLTDRSKLLAPDVGVFFQQRAELPLNIEVDASKRYQEMVGFGAARSLDAGAVWPGAGLGLQLHAADHRRLGFFTETLLA